MTEREKIWQDYYNKCSEFPDLMFQSARFDIAPFQFKAIIDDVIGKLPIDEDDVLLDVGCSNGMIDMHLAPRCRKLIGVDLSEQSLQLARQNNSMYAHTEFIRADAENLPLETNSIDKILMYGVSMHGSIDWMKRVITEFIRVSRDGAIILIGDNISPGLWRKYKKNKGYLKSFRHYCELNPDDLSFMPLRVLWYFGRKNVEMSYRKWRMPEIRNNNDPVKDPTENAAFEDSELLQVVKDLGQEAEIKFQNYRLPYSRFRYDLIIKVNKPEAKKN